MTTRTILCAAWLAAAVFEAHAQPQAVYRCGNAYSAQPCEGGAALAIQAAPAQADAAAAAQRAAQRDAKLADEMERERLAAEKTAPRAVIFRSSRMDDGQASPAGDKQAGKARTGKARAGKDFRAVSPGAKRSKD